jgi:hypothetical protein
VFMDDPTRKLTSRNGRDCRQRNLNTIEFRKRKLAAIHQDMRVIAEVTVVHGNGWGKQYCLLTQGGSRNIPSKYWIQLCCFPCCSCPDFHRRHTRSLPYLPCKHILWLYKNIFHLDLESSGIVMQPILSIAEVRYLLDIEARNKDQ